jgi:predicted nucleic-acid-binding Zn-ribbon protein
MVVARKKFLSLEHYKKLIKRDSCLFCGYENLKKLPIENYSHNGGLAVADFKEKQWLFITCPQCSYQWALWKLCQK